MKSKKSTCSDEPRKESTKARSLEALVQTFDETEITCPHWVEGKTLTYLEAVNGVHFECKNFSSDFCKLTDITKFFVTHCKCPANCPYCADKSENQVVPQSAGEVSEQFNYAVLSAEIGDYLKRKEQQLKNEYMNFTANCGAIFAEVQERLAKDGHGTFCKWVESMGFKKDTVYRMIDVHKFRLSLSAKDENTQQEIFDALPKYLQYEVAKPSAPPELVEQVMNGDITTHKDYIALKKQLADTKAACDYANKKRDENYSQYQDEHRKNYELEKRIEELESRPVNVAVHKDEAAAAEISRLKRELSKAQQDIIDASFGGTSDNGELLTELYETLHGNALSAIRNCADFAEKNGGSCVRRFRSLAEVINDYINEMEEF